MALSGAADRNLPQPTEEGGFNLVWALGLSILAHLLLWLLIAQFPALFEVVPAQVKDEPKLHFTFAPTAADRDTTRPARGDSPDAAPAQPPANTSHPIPAPPGPGPASPGQQPQLPPISAPTSVPNPATEPDSPLTPAEDPSPQERVETVEPQTQDGKETTVDAPEEPSLPLPDADRGLPRQDQPQASPAPSPKLDVQQALRQFRQDVERSRAARPSAPGGGSPQNVFIPDTSTLPMRGAPFGILEFASRDYDWSDYSSQIYWAILRAWYDRLYVTTEDFEKWAHRGGVWSLNHQSQVTFVIERVGDVTGIQLVQTSDCEPLDQSALDALSEVILPPLPSDFPRESELVRATFLARGDIAQMKPMFRYLKRIGYF